jgi:peptide/nickel transport system substrate-binding protein
MRNRLSPLILLVLVVGLLAAACQGGDSGGEPAVEAPATEAAAGAQEATQEAAAEEAAAEQAAAPEAVNGSFPRNETLYTGGTAWGPPSTWNPLQLNDYATGTFGLVYEPLFLYDPLTDEYTPWLAESGEWTSDNVYELKLRQGVTWSDGEPFTAEDVVFTIELCRIPAVPWSTLCEWLDSAEAVDDYTVRLTFSEPLYQEWANFLYDRPMLPEHIWSQRSEEEITTGSNENPIGTGPYLYESHDQDRMVWRKTDTWWATEQLGLEVKPTYIVDIVNSSNNVALGQVLQGDVDLNNNFLPGVSQLVEGGYGIQTYFPDPPYMLSANTAWLVPNTTRPPLDDPAFRRAMAFGIDVNKIVTGVYGNLVRPANPTGLLPNWEKYVDQEVVDELGFSYDPERARQILADAGYEDTDGDGFVEAPDGSKIELSLIVPNGWTD